jgi:hypothetical protein
MFFLGELVRRRRGKAARKEEGPPERAFLDGSAGTSLLRHCTVQGVRLVFLTALV